MIARGGRPCLRVGAHKGAFIVKLQDSGGSEVALALGYDFVNFEETRFATPVPALGRGAQGDSQKPPPKCTLGLRTGENTH